MNNYRELHSTDPQVFQMDYLQIAQVSEGRQPIVVDSQGTLLQMVNNIPSLGLLSFIEEIITLRSTKPSLSFDYRKK